MRKRTLQGLIGLVALVVGAAGDPAYAAPGLATGLLPPSAEESAWAEQHMIIADTVRLNALAVSRLADDRQALGLWDATSLPEPVPFGEEISGQTAATIASRSSMSDGPAPLNLPLPSSVDNSSHSQTRDFFPPIRSQGSIGSCASWATLYYAMSYETARARGWNARTGGFSRVFSPKWGYNALNRGNDNGSSVLGNIMIASQHGVALWSEWPYHTTNTPLAYREWCPDPQVWRRALGTRLADYGVLAEADTEAGFEQLKAALANGQVLVISTYISSWRSTRIKDDPAVTNDNPFVNQHIAFEVNGTAGAHAMTVVGYNDHVWCDINSNNIVDPGEKGAFKIANSWGAGDGNSGYRWMAYDALRRTTSVAGWTPGTNRQYGFYDRRPYWLRARADYTPALVAEVTVRHARRVECALRLGVGTTNQTTPTATRTFSMPSGTAGDLGFDGRSYSNQPSAAPAFTLVYDFTELLTNGTVRYFAGLSNTRVTNQPGVALSYRLLDGQGQEVAVAPDGGPGGMPLIASNSTIRYAWIETSAAAPPSVTIAASATEIFMGDALILDATAHDPQGAIVEYRWATGDGRPDVAGPYWTRFETAYPNHGIFTASVTVVGQGGRTARAHLPITVFPPPIRIASKELPPGLKGETYQSVLRAEGGVPPYQWLEPPDDHLRYTEPSTFVLAGTGRHWKADDGSWLLTLPFGFPFYNRVYTQCWVDSNGRIRFDGSGSSYDAQEILLAQTPMIAALWDDLDTRQGDVFVASESDRITIRWSGAYYGHSNATVAFSATLERDGAIILRYGEGNTFGGMIGISAGDTSRYTVVAGRNAGSRDRGDDVTFRPALPWPDGLHLVEAGRIEGHLQEAGLHVLSLLVRDAAGQTRYAEPVLQVFASDTTDTDGDGMSDYHEWLAGTDPHNPDSCLLMAATTSLPGEAPALTWSSQSGRRYQVWRTTSLSEPFLPVSDWMPATPPRNAYEDPEWPGQGFYLIEVALED
ncbi:MAG TPA: PKD domain-containing protein [Kiritimatiellia bacterium]|nr:PKD domain-containing protein [Kiritimatiellia bacterium]